MGLRETIQYSSIGLPTAQAGFQPLKRMRTHFPVHKAGRQTYAGGRRRCEEDTDEERRAAAAAHTLSSLCEE